jgi:hypothetical protein
MFYRYFFILLLVNSAYAHSIKGSGVLANIAYNKVKQSIAVKFDFILDEDINQYDPRIKSLVYCAKSDRLSKIEISYHNHNAYDTANKLGLILSRLGLTVVKPKQLAINHTDEHVSRYVFVKINYIG